MVDRRRGTNVFNTNGPLFGGTVGFNIRSARCCSGSRAISTGPGSVAASAIAPFNSGGAVSDVSDQEQLLGTVRARVGYALDRTLIYVTGGAAFAPVQAGLSPPGNFDTNTKFGWAAGAGVEYAFFGNWSAKAEYLYIDLASGSCSTVANCGTATGSSVAFTENIVRGGINYRFPW